MSPTKTTTEGTQKKLPGLIGDGPKISAKVKKCAETLSEARTERMEWGKQEREHEASLIEVMIAEELEAFEYNGRKYNLKELKRKVETKEIADAE